MRTPRKTLHKHRRSQAISGDFDAIGLGLFNGSTSPANSNVLLSDEELNRHFQFNNKEDFTNSIESFSFPNKDLGLSNSLPKKLSHSSLNSPIRFKKQTTKIVQSPTPVPRLFLTEETIVNNENIPEPMIDLDEIFNSLNLSSSPRVIRHKRMESAPANIGILGSPFIKEEEEDSDVLEETTEEEDEVEEELLQPPTSTFYHTILEDPFESKRSGANANRYKIFYDQSNKISNILKSSESLSLTSNTATTAAAATTTTIKHSSSLSNLKHKNSVSRFPPRAVSSPLKLESNVSSPISDTNSDNTPIIPNNLPPLSTPATSTSEEIKPSSPISWQEPGIAKSKKKHHPSPVRPESVAECNILKNTTIPKFKPKPKTPEFNIFHETNHPPQYMNKRSIFKEDKEETSFRRVKYWFKRHQM